jgi:hypothetical protein
MWGLVFVGEIPIISTFSRSPCHEKNRCESGAAAEREESGPAGAGSIANVISGKAVCYGL